MRRMERRMYKRRRGRAAVIWMALAAVLTGSGVYWLSRSGSGLTADALHDPTPTPVSAAFDQSVETREITLDAVSWFAIQTGVYSTQQAAQEHAKEYADRGAPGYVAQDGEKWRVLIACFGDKADASGVRSRLSSLQQVETYLHEWQCPQVRLRLSGMAGQLDVVQAGLALMRQAAERLRDTAAALDGGEYTAAEAAESVEQLHGEATLWAEVARERFGQPYPALVKQLLAWMQTWEGCRKRLQQASQEGATAFSAALKHQAMTLYEVMIDFRNGLNQA